MRQLSHSGQHRWRALLGLLVGNTAHSRGKDGTEGSRVHSRPGEGAACLLPLQPGTAIHGNEPRPMQGAGGECLEQLHPKCKPRD